MSRRILTWLILIRSSQILASFIPAAMNGWLLYYLYNNRLGASQLMLLSEILIAIVLAYSFVSVLVIHTGQRSKSTAWMVASVCLDVAFCLVVLTIICLLSYTGLPSNCSGLTTSPPPGGGQATLPPRGYTTIGFSNEPDGYEGGLDNFCGLERGFFVCAVLLILAYILSMVLSIFRICELNYTPKSEVQSLLREREDTLKLELKLQEQEPRSQPSSPGVASATTFASLRPDNQEEMPAAMYSSTSRSENLPSSSRSTMPSSVRFANANLTPMPQSSAHQHAYTRVLSTPAIPTSSMPMNESAMDLNAANIQANMAMVSDGSRYSGAVRQIQRSQLPPYSPGNLRRMTGHGDEDNDTRLSEYVKGETRAQDMKDSGGFQ